MKLHAVQVRILFFPLGSSSNGRTWDFDSRNTGSIPVLPEIADWCNGNTSDSDSEVLGSNPRSAV